VLYSRRVKPGREADFEAWARGILAAARQFPGHLGAAVLDAPGSRERHILFSFADRKSLQAWLDSAERHHWLARVEELLETDRGLQQLTGLETWFKLPGANVPTMKPPPAGRCGWSHSWPCIRWYSPSRPWSCPGWWGCRCHSERWPSRWCC
jgi:antibiotic biosynthesis monooxygenase (ABM) superfamily enzyme